MNSLNKRREGIFISDETLCKYKIKVHSFDDVTCANTWETKELLRTQEKRILVFILKVRFHFFVLLKKNTKFVKTRRRQEKVSDCTVFNYENKSSHDYEEDSPLSSN